MNYVHAPIDRTDEHLRLLAIFHYVFAGLALLGIGFLFLHSWMMSSMMDPAMWEGRPGAPPPQMMAMFRWMYVGFGAVLVTASALNVLAAQALKARRRWMLCAVVAGLNCLQMPFGTALGVITLVLLNKSEVRAQFQG